MQKMHVETSSCDVPVINVLTTLWYILEVLTLAKVSKVTCSRMHLNVVNASVNSALVYFTGLESFKRNGAQNHLHDTFEEIKVGGVSQTDKRIHVRKKG